MNNDALRQLENDYDALEAARAVAQRRWWPALARELRSQMAYLAEKRLVFLKERQLR